MNMHFIDWLIVATVLTVIIWAAVSTKKFTKSVADFLAANRCAGRYLICVSEGMAGLGAISVIAFFEMYYNAGFTALWWMMLMTPLWLFISLSGFVIYRFRETRAFTMAQFFEMRYSKSVRIFAGILVWLSGIINFGIFPAVGARFFIYFCGLPDYFTILGIHIPTFTALIFILLSISLMFTFLGGQIAVIVTDFLQGMFSNIVFLTIIILFFFLFDWSTVIETLKTNAPVNASLIHPFHTSKVDGFNFFFFIIGALLSVYGVRAWQGSQGYNCSAKSAHEARMAGILGAWRVIAQTLFMVLLPVGAYVILHNASFAGIATQAKEAIAIAGATNGQLAEQMTVPITLAKFLPIGITGLLCAAMLCAFISTHDTYLHSWGSIFVQDVILPFRKKPFSPKTHIWLLRASILFVAIFIFMWSHLFRQSQHIAMFFAITGAIWLGGAGAVIIGGLYWRRGTTFGAFAALITGCTIAVGGILLQQSWPNHLYSWLTTNAPGVLDTFKNIVEGISARVPGINWKVTAEKFPIDGRWMSFFAAISAVTMYVACSLIELIFTKKAPFNLDEMLHRGKYAVAGVHKRNVVKPPTGLRAILPTKEFTSKDRLIYYANLSWTVIWFSVFLFGTIYNLTHDVTTMAWATFWKWYVRIFAIISFGTVFWFLSGGIIDLKNMFKFLNTAKRNLLDDGIVVDHHNLDEKPINQKAK
ncbi:MAG: sodium:solute symporter [Chlamydiae bacterium]|nr:MAG: sodium:solute symporter [Chlamydiota bacterium]